MQIDYIEFASPEMETTQDFFAAAFGWNFIDYGPDYRDIQKAGTGGGLYRAEAPAAPLIVLKSDDLEGALAKVRSAGAEITKEIFAFPGGQRFEFLAPGGIAMAVWTPEA